MSDAPGSDLFEYYARGEEQVRLTIDARGALEFERSAEIVLRRLPAVPSVVADVGGGPGRYSLWLAELGYQVEHRDLMPMHVEQLRDAATDGLPLRAEVGDARRLDLADGSVDAVLLFGPLYHLRSRADRLQALREARRIVRPGGPVFVAAISRWAPRLDGVLRTRLYEKYPHIEQMVDGLERTGWMPPLHRSSFTAYCHRPAQLRQEVRASGLTVVDVVGVEGAAHLIGDLDERLAVPRDWSVVLQTARATERVPELLGLGPHLIATAVRSPSDGEAQ